MMHRSFIHPVSKLQRPGPSTSLVSHCVPTSMPDSSHKFSELLSNPSSLCLKLCLLSCLCPHHYLTTPLMRLNANSPPTEVSSWISLALPMYSLLFSHRSCASINYRSCHVCYDFQFVCLPHWMGSSAIE